MIRENASHHEDQHRNGNSRMGGPAKIGGFGGLTQAAMNKNGIGASSKAGIHLPSPQTIK